MCGISGLVSRAPVGPAQYAAVRRMTAGMIHRGPDGEGWLEREHAVLAMRRLSIIDLAGAAQPLANDDGSVALVYNGEIYNYRELRTTLSAMGYRFRTQGDGEVIVRLYEQYGLDFVHHLRGMFAIALWDASRNRLVLARDRMGEKPLYLKETGNGLIFASEMKALLSSGEVEFALDPAAVHLYFHYQYVPEPMTAVQGIRKLEAGSLLVVDVAPWNVREHRYWRMEDAPPIEGEPVALLRAALDDAARIVVRADVPVGVALSGGLDSSVVAALAARHRGGDIATFSVGYPGRPAHDEREQAKWFAAQLKVDFHEIELTPDEMVDGFPALNASRDDPIADIAGFGYYAVMRAAHDRGVPVMLQGQGGDELFWGYESLRQARNDALRKQRDRARGISILRDLAGLRHGFAEFRDRWRTPANTMPFYDRAPDYGAARRHIASFYTPEFLEQIAETDSSLLFTFAQPWPDIEVTLTERICATYLRENGIAQGDRLGMASSVELRLPFMDHRFIETVIGLRRCHHDGSLGSKAWLKAAVTDIVPVEILERPKQGFAPPVRDWHAALFGRYGHSLVDGVLQTSGILSAAGAARLASGDFPHDAVAPLSFKALVLEQWCRQMAVLVPSLPGSSGD